MPRAMLVQVKRHILRFKFCYCFCFLILLRFPVVDLTRSSLDEDGFMVKMGSFAR